MTIPKTTCDCDTPRALAMNGGHAVLLNREGLCLHSLVSFEVPTRRAMALGGRFFLVGLYLNTEAFSIPFDTAELVMSFST
mmetsp:Transcript_25344/g.63975  ORF Transcript_25344/g.63975 Transcript_25344/m.63975 type:complete len:81 (+) Transcript_25344:1748-1990(+)